MTRAIIATLVGAVILYGWNALSWTVLPVHFHSFKYSPEQEEILQTLDEKLPESGTYIMPTADNRDVGYYDEEYQEEMQEIMKENEGSGALLFYYEDGLGEEVSSFITGFLFFLLSAFIAVILLSVARPNLNSFFQRWWFVMLVPLLVALLGPLSDWNWLGFHWHYIKCMLLDLGVSWGLCGLWLAYYLK
jgi:hypothetical protein